jgi:hypothetical protein
MSYTNSSRFVFKLNDRTPIHLFDRSDSFKLSFVSSVSESDELSSDASESDELSDSIPSGSVLSREMDSAGVLLPAVELDA